MARPLLSLSPFRPSSKARTVQHHSHVNTVITYCNADSLINGTWLPYLKDEFEEKYIQTLKDNLELEVKRGARIYPPPSLLYKALEMAPINTIKAVIVGQDPYHSPGQAEGLAFSVPAGVAIPSSLKNVYKELRDDVPGFQIPAHGCLHSWAAQGVLLLNASLTVRAHAANSHKDLGWNRLTDCILRSVVQRESEDPVVFLLWGKFAHQKAKQAGVYSSKRPHHLVLESAHPSGLSAHRGFFGCRHFSKANEFLKSRGSTPINWQI